MSVRIDIITIIVFVIADNGDGAAVAGGGGGAAAAGGDDHSRSVCEHSVNLPVNVKFSRFKSLNVDTKAKGKWKKLYQCNSNQKQRSGDWSMIIWNTTSIHCF